MRILVIVESPAKCKKIESYLGPGYKVMASYGHLRMLPSLEDVDVDNNFLPTYSLTTEAIKLKQIEKIREEIIVSDEVIIATDDDREGEAIGWHICDLFGLSVTNTKRLIFHEITKSAIQSAIRYPTKINMKLVESQQARQILDLLVGFTITPILWNNISKTYDKSLSAGRCQTPALRIVYENHLENQKSPGKIIYNTIGFFTGLNLAFELNKDFTETDEIKLFLEECKTFDTNFKCIVSSPKKTIRKPPEPLTTSSLQQLASNELHLSPKETMKYAQQLYEEGYITYMRTDSKKYSDDFIKVIKEYIKTNYSEKFVREMDTNTNTNTNTNNIQEAHESIRPTDITNKTIKNEKSKLVKLYELIWKRTMESCMTSAQYNTITAKITAPQNTEFVYKTEQPIFLGWHIINNPDPDSSPSQTNYNYIFNLKKDVSLIPKRIIAKQKLIEKKSHLTEARLVQILEERGIGRPSTFASLVDKIQERKYVEKGSISGTKIECKNYELEDKEITETITEEEFGNEHNKLIIQPLGIIVIEFLLKHFQSFFNYEYTKQMEDMLDNIAIGEIVWHKLCFDCNQELTKLIKKENVDIKYNIKIDDIHSLIIGKYGPVVKCTKNKVVTFLPVKKDLDIKTLETNTNIKLEDILETNGKTNGAIGKYKGEDLFIKNGKYGLYAQWGKEMKSLKDEFGHMKIDDIKYIDVLKYLEKDGILDPSKPMNVIRILNDQISIRTGKYGDYIFYKKPRVKNPVFLKLNGFKLDYKKCDKDLILNWIKETYNLTFGK
jgi:DNA topoisomerase-1